MKEQTNETNNKSKKKQNKTMVERYTSDTIWLLMSSIAIRKIYFDTDHKISFTLLYWIIEIDIKSDVFRHLSKDHPLIGGPHITEIIKLTLVSLLINWNWHHIKW